MKKLLILLLLLFAVNLHAQSHVAGLTSAAMNTFISPYTGTYQGSVISGTYGGTGVNNGGNTITLGGNLITSGSFDLTITLTGTTGVTFPTSGTLVNSAVATLSSLTSIGSSPTLVTPSITTGFTIGGVAATGTFPRGNGTNFIASTLTIPNTSTTGDIFVSTGTSVMGVVAVNATANKVLMSGASAVPTWSTPTFPNASATTRKIIVSDGTNWVASTETYAVPGTSGNVLTSNGTNWTSATPSAGGLTVTAITADQTAAVGNAYVNNKSGSILSITLPTTASVGQQIKVYGGTNTAFFKFIYTTNQKIHYGGSTSTTTTGNLTAGEQWDEVLLTCIVVDNEWLAEGTGTITLN